LTRCNATGKELYLGHSEPAPTSAPTWMDGALMGFSFLSQGYWQVHFILSSLRTQFLFFILKLYPPPTYSHLPTLHSPPPTYSSIHLKFVTLIPTYVPTHPSIYLPARPFTFLPTSPLGKYLLDPTYMTAPPYLAATPTDLAIVKKQ
jgi:hypothetical protein